MNYKLSTLLLFFAITVASAQGKKWSLQECVEYVCCGEQFNGSTI